jgi:dipeptidyl aminopeptidase/acylaminoacyl peptidase
MIKEANLTVEGLKIVGQLHLPENQDPPYPAVILCHGVPSGNVDPSDPGYPFLAQTISDQGFAVYIFRFRGAGESEGNFDIAGWTRDLIAAINYISDLPVIDKNRLALVGFSAGATVSVYVAARDHRITAVAACACPAEFSAVTDPSKSGLTLAYFRKIGIIRDPDFPPSPENWLNDFRKVNALHSVADISPRPLLLLHAKNDNVVPSSNAEKLYQLAGDPKQLVIIEGSEHRLRRDENAVKILIQWLKDQLQYPDSHPARFKIYDV